MSKKQTQDKFFDVIPSPTASQAARARRKAAKREGIASTRAINRSQDQRDFIAARARRAPAGSIGAALR